VGLDQQAMEGRAEHGGSLFVVAVELAGLWSGSEVRCAGHRPRRDGRAREAASGAGGGVDVGVVEGVEGGAAVDVELEGLAGAGVENRDGYLCKCLVQKDMTSIASLVRWASSRGWVNVVAAIAAPPSCCRSALKHSRRGPMSFGGCR
jgi:hypothetical protein